MKKYFYALLKTISAGAKASRSEQSNRVAVGTAINASVQEVGSDLETSLLNRLATLEAGIDRRFTALQADVSNLTREMDLAFRTLYEMAHDKECSAPFASRRTVAAFGHQWAKIPCGKYMLSDPVFKQQVDRIISEEELQLDRAWFPGKRVLDAGCGGGRWSYGLAKLGANVTAADTNPSAVAATRAALEELGAPAEFLLSDLETIDTRLPHESFDLVWSWGVLHHCTSFLGALRSISKLVKPGGVIHLYLYGRDSIGFDDDVRLFKERLRFNYLRSEEERLAFLEEKAKAIDMDVHHAHDLYAPIINRRFEFDEVREILRQLGFTHIERTIEHTELWLRALKGPNSCGIKQYELAKKAPPYWFQM